MENVKEGLSEKKEIKESDSKFGMTRENPGQIPTKKPVEKASKGGKSFKIS